MGSWFSSSDPPRYILGQLKDELCQAYTEEVSEDAYCIRDLASGALKHYNSNHPGAEFLFPAQRTMATYACVVCPPTKDMKGASVGFRRNLWYHVNFVARRWKGGDGHDERTFFAELCYDNSSHRLIVQTCTILEEKPSRSSCAMCPEESKILHPDDAEFVCGKQGHEREFFSETSWDGHTKEFFSQSAMLSTPFLYGGQLPRYRLPDE